MVRYVMTIILAVEGNMKWMMTFNICMIHLNRIIEINIYIDL